MSSPYSSELRKVAEKEKPFMEKLNSGDQNQQWEAICEIRNAIVGNRRQKANFIVMGIIHHLTTIIRCSTSPDGLKRDAITLMTSLSKGSANNIIAMCDYGAYQTIIDVLLHSTDELLLASLRCMLSIISSVHQIGSKADQRTLQTRQITIAKFESPEVLDRLVCVLDNKNENVVQAALSILKKMAKLSKKDGFFIVSSSETAQKLRIRIFNFVEKSKSPGDIELLSIQLLVRWLQRAGTDFIVQGNPEIFGLLFNFLSMFDDIVACPLHDDFEIAICRCLVYLFEHSSDKSSAVVVRRLSSLCSSKNPDTRIKAAFSLAKLLETRPDLQELAFYSHQLPKKIQKFFQLPQGALDGCSQSQVRKFTKELNAYSRLRCAGLTLLAALTRDDERLRTAVLSQKNNGLQIINMEKESWAMEALIEALAEQQDPNDPAARAVLVASLKCLHSFSRSDQHLRTTIEDYQVYTQFIQLFIQHKTDEELLMEMLPILANFMLFFCPSKEELIQLFLMDIATILLRQNLDLKMASLALACLINMTHQTEGRIRDKNDLIQLVSIRALFELSENFPTLTVQILCLFRNLVDENSLLVESKGDEILKVVQFWLASELSSKYPDKRRLCAIGAVLRNLSAVSDGVTKICSSEELVKLVVALFQNEDLLTRTQASYVITNLLRHNDETFTHRQKVLRSAGLVTAIHQSTADFVRPINCSKLNENVENILKRLGEL